MPDEQLQSKYFLFLEQEGVQNLCGFCIGIGHQQRQVGTAMIREQFEECKIASQQ